MREFIRHPTDIPLEYHLTDVVADEREYLRDISRGGLCFRAKHDLPLGSIVFIQIPMVNPIFSAEGVVVWTNKAEDHFEIGVEFQDVSTEFALRMVEQICYIEEYKKEVFEKHGRQITGEEAALEWISKYAADFPA